MFSHTNQNLERKLMPVVMPQRQYHVYSNWTVDTEKPIITPATDYH
jgi:hypothetical protein